MIQEMDPPSPFRLESFGNMSRQVEHAIQEQQQRMQHAHRRVDDAGGRIRQLENGACTRGPAPHLTPLH